MYIPKLNCDTARQGHVPVPKVQQDLCSLYKRGKAPPSTTIGLLGALVDVVDQLRCWTIDRKVKSQVHQVAGPLSKALSQLLSCIK